jgi:Ca-activated chloride channel family protein
MAYGHREKGSCDDIEIIVEPATGTGPAILEAANALQFIGKTPLTESVRRAALALRSTEEKATVILITDGIETCAADPCALGAELEATGVDFTAHVVGFGLTAEEGREVACLAEKTGGTYIEAGDLAGLIKALETTVIEAVPELVAEPVVETPAPAALEVNFAPSALLAPGVTIPDDSSDIVWEILTLNPDGTTGERITTGYNDYKDLIAPGTYRLITSIDKAAVESDITLTADTLTAPEIVLNAARVILHPKAAADAPVNDGAALNFTTASGIDTTSFGSSRIYLPAGDVTLTASLGLGQITETLSLTPGQLLEKDVIIGTGLAVVDGYYTEGMIMDTTQHSVEILAAKKALDGSRASLTTSYGPGQKFDLPPGEYVAIVSQGAASAEVPFSVKTGERVDVTVILNAGVLAVTAPGANEIEVFEAKADINGNRKQVGFDYATEQSFTLPEGDYLITAKQGEAQIEGPANVKKGERTEITLTLP